MKFLRDFFNAPQETSSRFKAIYAFELLILSALTVYCLLYFSFTHILVGDEREHVYASFLVYLGKIPYRDFFEHHHPLLWYTFYPFMIFFNNSPNIWYAARSYALILLAANIFILIKLGKQMISWDYGLLAAIFSVSTHCVFIAQTEYRPDTLMMTTFLYGLYFYFMHLKNKKEITLHLAFIFFLLSVFALQKACLQLVPVALLTIYLLYKKEIKLKTFLKALIIPGFLIIAYMLYLYYTRSLKDYFELNWLLNLKINFNMKYKVTNTLYYSLANILAISALLTKTPKIMKYIAFLCLGTSLILQYGFESPFIQYWLPVYPYFALISAYYILKFAPYPKVFVLGLIIIASLHNDMSYIKAIQTFPKLNMANKITSQEINLSKPTDTILGSLERLGGLRTDATGYYWFGRDYIAQLDAHYFKRHELPNINQILKTERPKLVSGKDEISCTTADFRYTSNCQTVTAYDTDYLKEHYTYLGRFYIRKD